MGDFLVGSASDGQSGFVANIRGLLRFLIGKIADDAPFAIGFAAENFHAGLDPCDIERRNEQRPGETDDGKAALDDNLADFDIIAIVARRFGASAPSSRL